MVRFSRSIHTRIDEATKKRLEKIARKQRLPEAVVVRDALVKFAELADKPKAA